MDWNGMCPVCELGEIVKASIFGYSLPFQPDVHIKHRTYLDREQHEKVERMILTEYFRFNKYNHKKSMNNFGFPSQVSLDASPSHLPASIHFKLRDKLDHNPPDKDWRALVRAVEDRYYISQYTVAAFSGSESPASKLLVELACQGITVRELDDYLDRLKIETYNLGLRRFEDIVIQSQPGDSKEVFTGHSLFLEVEATGHPYPEYQWFFWPEGENDEKDGIRLEGRTDRILRIDNVTKNNAGCYTCQVHQKCGQQAKVKYTGLTLVCVNPVPAKDVKQPVYVETGEGLTGRNSREKSVGPDTLLRTESCNGYHNLIIQQPSDLDVEMNTPFLLEVGTQGRPPIHYQGLKDGNLMCGKDTNILQVSHAMPDFGEYQYIVQDGSGVTEKSRKVSVKKWPPLSQSENGDRLSSHPVNEIIIISQPKSCTVKFGGDALFHCEAKCNSPLQYMWYKDGKPMDDQTEPEIQFVNIQDRQREGLYQCYVYVEGGNIRDAMLSFPALLTIEVPAVNENIEYNPSDKVALLIGNSDYRCEESLIAPPYDVQRLTESFRNLEFKVVSLLNLSKTEIETAVLHFCKLIDRNVYVVFYFCGHGFEEDGCYFLVPTDAVHGYGINECVCVESILENFQKKSPPLILMMMDICRKLNRIKGNGLPSHLAERIAKGNTVYGLATSVGLNAFEDSKEGVGLLAHYLQPLLHQKLGIDQLWINLKEEFHRDGKYTKLQLPELRSNIIEPRRSLADRISYRGETELFHKRSMVWRDSHIKPEKQRVRFEKIGVVIELDFQTSFSNVLDVYIIVRNRGNTKDCVPFLNSWPSQVSLISKNKYTGVQCTTTKYSFADIQRLQGNMLVSIGVKYRLGNDTQDRLDCHCVNLGLPLVAKLQWWRPQPGFYPQSREAIEQMEDESVN